MNIIRPLRRILVLAIKDMKDAIRDARVLVALIVPLGIGLFYGFAFDDSAANIVHASLAISSADQTDLIGVLVGQLPDNVRLQVNTYPDADTVKQRVGAGNEDIGLILPAGFDDALKNQSQPELTVVQSPTTTIEGNYILASLDPALRQMAGQNFPANVELIRAPKLTSDNVSDRIGLRTWSLLLALVMSIGLVAILAMPIVLVEEVEKKTLDALILAMDYWEVVVGKTLLGLSYIAVMTAILVLLTGIDILHWFLFAGAVGLTSIAMMGIGLLLAGLFKSANQLNTWAGVLLGPLIAPAIVVGTPVPHVADLVASLFPTGAGMKLLINTVTTDRFFTNELGMIGLLIAWIVVLYTLLIFRLNRHQL